MPTTAWPALGTTLSYSIDAGVTWVSIGQVTTLSKVGGSEIGERDTTNLASTAKTNAPTIPDHGEATFELNYDPTDVAHIQLMSWSGSPGTIPMWKAAYATSPVKSATFSGWVKTLDGVNAGGVDDNLAASVTIRVTGAVTWS